MNIIKFKNQVLNVTQLCSNINIAFQNKNFIRNLKNEENIEYSDYSNKIRSLIEILVFKENKEKIEEIVSLLNGLVKICYEENINFYKCFADVVTTECEIICEMFKDDNDTFQIFINAIEDECNFLELDIININDTHHEDCLIELVKREFIILDTYKSQIFPDIVTQEEQMKYLEKSLDKSFKKTMHELPTLLDAEINKLPFKNLEDKKEYILDEIAHTYKNTEIIFSNKKSYVKYQLENSSLGGLESDLVAVDLNNVCVSEKSTLSNPYFENFTKGLTIGYTNKAILLGVDKDKTIIALQEEIKYLEKRNIIENNKLIQYLESLINFIKQKNM